MNTELHFSSDRMDWETPWDFFNIQSAKYGPFDLDVCAIQKNTKCAKFYSPDDNSLTKNWFGKCWMNPPYGREIVKWVAKAVSETQNKHADCVVCLLPSRTDTSWWHDYVIENAVEVNFIRGRIKFEGAKNSAPFPSAVVVFK